MQIEESTLKKLVGETLREVIEELGLTNQSANVETVENVENVEMDSKVSAFLKTEQLFDNYLAFHRLVEVKQQEINDYRTFGVPNKRNPFEFNPHCGNNEGIVLPEETVEIAVRTVQRSVDTIVQAIALVNTGMAAIKDEPYYEIIPKLYLTGMTMEEIGKSIGKDIATVSRQRVKLLKKASLAMFPEEVLGKTLESAN